jgi:squalene-hopene/tetraprenyl-beta-curcumene cyclase
VFGDGGIAKTDAREAARDYERAIRRARRHLLSLQHPDGYWCGELQGDTILESEYILLMAWLDQLDQPQVKKVSRYLAQQQLTAVGRCIRAGK